MEQIEAMEEKELTILQIMPALPGWGAVWGTREEPEKGESGFFTEPVVCWALVEASDGHRFVTAMAADLETEPGRAAELLAGLADWVPYFLALSGESGRAARQGSAGRRPRTPPGADQCRAANRFHIP